MRSVLDLHYSKSLSNDVLQRK